MKKLKKLTRNQKEFLAEQGYNADDFLLERKDAWRNVAMENIKTYLKANLAEFKNVKIIS